MKFHHVGIEVSDINACITFYEDILGFEGNGRFHYGEEEIYFLEKDGIRIELIENKSKPDSGGECSHFCFEVEHLDAIIEEFSSRNIVPVEGPFIMENWKIIFYQGIGRELIEFLEVL